VNRCCIFGIATDQDSACDKRQGNGATQPRAAKDVDTAHGTS
jgi:hypothetical protein